MFLEAYLLPLAAQEEMLGNNRQCGWCVEETGQRATEEKEAVGRSVQQTK